MRIINAETGAARTVATKIGDGGIRAGYRLVGNGVRTRIGVPPAAENQGRVLIKGQSNPKFTRGELGAGYRISARLSRCMWSGVTSYRSVCHGRPHPGSDTLRRAAILALLAALMLPPGPAAAEAPASSELRSIQVRGKAKVSVSPDRARLSVAVVTRAATASAAARRNAEKSAAVLDRLRAGVGEAGEVSTGSYSLDPDYEYKKLASGNRRELIGYKCSNTISVVTRRLEQVGRLIDASVAGGANEIRALEFFLADDSEPRKQATLIAGRKALAEADTVAESLGVERGELLWASTEYSRPPVQFRARAMAMDMTEAAVPTGVVPGNVDVSAVVTAVFEIQ